MVGPVTGQIAIDLAVLALMTVAFMCLVGCKMNWRQE
jgi:hypothetical protein